MGSVTHKGLTLHYYNGGWGTKTTGSSTTYFSQNGGNYRTVIPITVTPNPGHKIKTFSITGGVVCDNWNYRDVTVSGYAYTDLTTARQYKNLPAGYIASDSVHLTSADANGQSGRLTFDVSSRNYTSTTTFYIWICSSKSYPYEYYTYAAGNMGDYTASMTEEGNGTVWIYASGKWRRAVPYVYTGGKWRRAIPYVYTGGKWRMSGG